MTKLRQQFLDILQDAELLPRNYTSRMWDTQSEDIRRELKQLRKKNRVDQRKKKVLKLDDEGVSGCDLYVYYIYVCTVCTYMSSGLNTVCI